MASSERMSASLAVSTVLYALSRGVSVPELVAATELPIERLLQAEGWVPDDVVPRVWRLLADRNPGAPVALDMARQASPRLFAELMPAVAHCPDLRTLLRTIVRCRGLLADALHLELVETEQTVELHFHHPADALAGGYGAELGAGFTVRSLDAHFGIGDALQAVGFRHAPLCELAHYRRFFGVEPDFEQPTHRLVWGREVLDRENRHASPELGLFVQRHLDHLMETRGARRQPALRARVNAAIATNAARGDFSAAALARRMGMSARSLQRALAAEGLTAAGLLQEARLAYARQLLRSPHLSLDEIAALLGYGSERSFRRAFRRSTGRTPTAVRREG